MEKDKVYLEEIAEFCQKVVRFMAGVSYEAGRFSLRSQAFLFWRMAKEPFVFWDQATSVVQSRGWGACG